MTPRRRRHFSCAAAAGLLALLAPALGACGKASETLGLERSTPDEYAVAVGPNLVVPPDYGLRAPGAGEPPPPNEAAAPASEDVLATLTDRPDAPSMSPGEKALLEAAGAARVDPAIRQRITESTQGTAVENDLFVEDILFWKDSTPEPPQEPVIDPDKEAARSGVNAAPGSAPE